MPRLQELDWFNPNNLYAPAQRDAQWNQYAAQSAPLYEQARAMQVAMAYPPPDPNQAAYQFAQGMDRSRAPGYSYINGQVYLGGQQQPGTYTEQQGRELANRSVFDASQEYERRLMGRTPAGLERRITANPRFQRLDDEQKELAYRLSTGRDIQDAASNQMLIDELNLDRWGPEHSPTSANDLRVLRRGLQSAGYENPQDAFDLPKYQRLAGEYGLPAERPMAFDDRLKLAEFERRNRESEVQEFERIHNMAPGELLSYYEPDAYARTAQENEQGWGAISIPSKDGIGEPQIRRIPPESIERARMLTLGEQANMARGQQAPDPRYQRYLELLQKAGEMRPR